MNKEMQVKMFRDQACKLGVSPDLVDFEAEVDESLHFFENAKHVSPLIRKAAGSSELSQLAANELKRRDLVAISELEDAFAKEMAVAARQADLRAGVGSPAEVFKQMSQLVAVVARKGAFGLMIWGTHGTGKSWTCVQTLNGEGLVYGKDWAIINSFSTSLAFYKLLHEHRDRIILLDDCDALFNDRKNIAMLKAALGEIAGKRFVSYHSTTDKLEGVPSVFEFKGRIIVTANRIRANDPDIAALLSRVLVFEVRLSYDQKIALLREVCTFPDKKYSSIPAEAREEVLGWLIRNTDSSFDSLSCRSLTQLWDIASVFPKGWKSLAGLVVCANPDLVLYHQAGVGSASVGEWCKCWCALSGGSRSGFFRLHRSMKR